FALQLRERFSLASISLVAITAGLGILTKATMLMFALVPAGIVLRTISKSPGRSQKLLYASVQIVSLALILGPFLIQNERLYQSLLGRHQTPTGILIYTNEVFSPASLLSNILRNLINQVPMPLFGNSVQAVLATLHNVIGIDLNDPRTTWYGEQFHVMSVLFPQEDLAANPLQLLIFCIAGFGVLRSRSSMIAYLYVSLIAAFCVFSGLLKWQPWHSRLLLPLFSPSTVVSWAILLEKRKLLRFEIGRAHV